MFLQYDTSIQNCSSSNLACLPSSVPNFTDWLILENNAVSSLDSFPSFFETVRFVNLSKNKISSINIPFLRNVSQSQTLKWLDLSNNDLRSLPPEVQELNNLDKIWLGGNPIHCDCEMTWMIDWLNNFTAGLYRQHVVVDYTQVKCHSGQMKGKPIYLLNQVDMGCYPHDWTTHQKLIVGVSTGIAIIVIVIIIGLYSRRARFLMYYYLNLDTIPADDKNENLKDIEYDAFFCYRLVVRTFYPQL